MLESAIISPKKNMRRDSMEIPASLRWWQNLLRRRRVNVEVEIGTTSPLEVSTESVNIIYPLLQYKYSWSEILVLCLKRDIRCGLTWILQKNQLIRTVRFPRRHVPSEELLKLEPIHDLYVRKGWVIRRVVVGTAPRVDYSKKKIE